MTDRNTVAVIGAGMMGPGIAARSVLAGHPTVLIARTADSAVAGAAQARQHIAQLLASGLVEKGPADQAPALLTTATDVAHGVADAFLVIETINEDLALKQTLFEQLDALLPPDVIITSNTSGLRITDIAERTRYPQRTATTHFWFPPHLIPLVEVVMGDHTDEAVALRLHALLLLWKKAPVIVRMDTAGQLGNRILHAISREAVNIVAMGLATPEDVDTAIKMGMALRFPAWAPLEHIDAVGLDLALAVQRGAAEPEQRRRAQPVPGGVSRVRASGL